MLRSASLPTLFLVTMWPNTWWSYTGCLSGSASFQTLSAKACCGGCQCPIDIRDIITHLSTLPVRYRLRAAAAGRIDVPRTRAFLGERASPGLVHTSETPFHQLLVTLTSEVFETSIEDIISLNRPVSAKSSQFIFFVINLFVLCRRSWTIRRVRSAWDIWCLVHIFSFIRHLGSNTIITIKEIKVLVYEIISNSITKWTSPVRAINYICLHQPF